MNNEKLIKIIFNDGKKISMSEKRAKELFWKLNRFFANKFVGKDTITNIIPNRGYQNEKDNNREG